MASRKVLTITEAAKELGICRQFAYESAKAGTIPTIRIGRRILVPRAALDRLLNGASQQEKNDPSAKRVRK